MARGRLDGKAAVVTGAGRGIGREIAIAFAAEGASVVVNDLGCTPTGAPTAEDPASETAAEIIANGGDAVANGSSVADVDGARGLVEAARATFGRLDILVNTAGIVNMTPLAELDERDWHAVMAVHVGGHLACATAAIGAMSAGGYGRIINFTSGVGLVRDLAFGAYAVAKRAVAALTRQLATELAGSPITVNAVSPLALTRLSGAPRDGAPVPPMLANLPPPELVAPLAVFLASPASGSVNGCIVFTNGYEVSLIEGPRVVETVRHDGSRDQLDLALERVLGPATAMGRSTGASAARLGPGARGGDAR